MSPIIRRGPGERVEITGYYELRGHYGEATGIAPTLLHKGDMFPLLGVDAEAGPLWYVRLYEAVETTQAA
jgi:hypothetical protein